MDTVGIIAIHATRGQSRNARRRSLAVMRAEQELWRVHPEVETTVQLLGDALWAARKEAGIRPKARDRY